MDILPCPFCGSSAFLGHNMTQEDIRMKISCTGEGCWATIEEWIGDEMSVERVLQAWNKRIDKTKTL